MDIACEMTREVFCDLWGMDESPPLPPLLASTAARQTQVLPPLPARSMSTRETTLNIRRGSDRRFPQLGVKSGNMKSLQQQSMIKIGTSENISSNESYLHQMMNQGDAVQIEGLKADSEDGSDHPNEEDEKSIEDNENEEVDNISENEEGSDEDVDSLSAIGTITEWTDRLRLEKMRIARDFILYTFECIVNICENRLELQDRIAQKSPYFFQALYGMILIFRLSHNNQEY